MADETPSILIVDDNRAALTGLERDLAPLGARLITLQDGHLLLDRVRAEKPDLVLLDALLPGLSGFDLCKQIKTTPDVKSTLVVILTGVYVKEQYRKDAINQFKADGFLTKPCRPTELQRQMLRLLATKYKMTAADLQRALKNRGKDGTVVQPPVIVVPAPAPKRGWLDRLFGRKEESALDETESAGEEAPVAPPAEEETGAESSSPPVESTDGAVALDVAREDEEIQKVETAEVVESPSVEEVLYEAPPEPLSIENSADTAQQETAEPVPDSFVESVVSSTEEPSAQTSEAVSQEVVVGVDERQAPSPAVFEQGMPAEIVEIVETVEAVQNAETAETEEPQEPAIATEPEQVEAQSAPPLLAEADASGSPEPVEEAQDGGTTVPPVALFEPPAAISAGLPVFLETAFFSEFKRELARSRRSGKPLTLMLIRIDDLSQIAELFGQEMKQRVLSHVAELAVETAREVDMAGLINSLELVGLAAFACDRYGGGRISARILKANARRPFAVGEALPAIIPALKFGLATYPTDTQELEGLMKRAREELSARPA